MAKHPNEHNPFADFMSAMPADIAMPATMRQGAELGEKLSKVALMAAEQSAAIASAWTKDTLAKLGQASKAKEDPSDYGRAAGDFASASFQTASENIVAFAEVAKRLQMETIEIVLAAGQDAASKDAN